MIELFPKEKFESFSEEQKSTYVEDGDICFSVLPVEDKNVLIYDDAVKHTKAHYRTIGKVLYLRDPNTMLVEIYHLADNLLVIQNLFYLRLFDRYALVKRSDKGRSSQTDQPDAQKDW